MVSVTVRKRVIWVYTGVTVGFIVSMATKTSPTTSALNALIGWGILLSIFLVVVFAKPIIRASRNRKRLKKDKIESLKFAIMGSENYDLWNKHRPAGDMTPCGRCGEPKDSHIDWIDARRDQCDTWVSPTVSSNESGCLPK